jgi:exodeoxyribonuclease VII small subunit
MTFEQSLEKLEKIVEQLETGELNLDTSLKKYEEGVKLARDCQAQLDEAKKTIETLVKDKKGQILKKKYQKEEE